MARKKVREYDAKRVLREQMKRMCDMDVHHRAVQVKEDTDWDQVMSDNDWLHTTKLVVKPDMLFGQRGKNDLVGLNLDLLEAKTFVEERMNKLVVVGQMKGNVNTFIVEPFMPHEVEYYLSINSKRLGDSILFCEAGGVEIEENWDLVKEIFVPSGEELSTDVLAPLINTLPLALRPKVEAFIKNCFAVFRGVDMTLLEMNPFTLDAGGNPFPLDMRMELDDTAAFKNTKTWGGIEFPLPFGRTMSPAENAVHEMDEKTGASLKLSILNPKGRVWTMVAGGGASVIYADTVGDLGYAEELGNYAEYSGAPSEEETLQYARVLLDCATANPDGRGRALLVGGGIANFTDVAATFRGIIKAMEEKQDKIKASGMRVYVRRGGPNYIAALESMKALGERTGIPIEVYGPETNMTSICKTAIDYIQACA